MGHWTGALYSLVLRSSGGGHLCGCCHVSHWKWLGTACGNFHHFYFQEDGGLARSNPIICVCWWQLLSEAQLPAAMKRTGGPLMGLLSALPLDAECKYHLLGLLSFLVFRGRLGDPLQWLLPSSLVWENQCNAFFKSILFGKSLDLHKSCKTIQGCFLRSIFTYLYLRFVSCWSSFLNCVSAQEIIFLQPEERSAVFLEVQCSC